MTPKIVKLEACMLATIHMTYWHQKYDKKKKCTIDVISNIWEKYYKQMRLIYSKPINHNNVVETML